MGGFSVRTLLRATFCLLSVVVVSLSFTAAGLGGLAVPMVILGVGIALGEHRTMPDRWHVKDSELRSLLDSGLHSHRQ